MMAEQNSDFAQKISEFAKQNGDFAKRNGDFAKRKPSVIVSGTTRQYAVLLPLVASEEGTRILFETRSKKLKAQPGEVSFPGGAIEEGETPREAAVRETCEELLVDPSQVEVLGAGDVLVTHYNQIIHTFIGRIHDYEGSFGTDEVYDVFTWPLEALMQDEPEVYETKINQEIPDDFPYELVPNGENYHWKKGRARLLFYQREGRVVWGMTGLLLESGLQLMREYGIR